MTEVAYQFDDGTPVPVELSDAAGLVYGHLPVAERPALDPLLILTIIQVIVSVVRSCSNRTPAQLHRAAERRGWLAWWTVRAACDDAIASRYDSTRWRRIGRWEHRRAARELTDAVFTAATQAGREAIAGVMGAVPP